MANTVVLHRAEIDKMMLTPGGKVYDRFSRYGDKVKKAARRKVPKDTRRGMASIDKNMRVTGRRLIVRVGTNLKYLLYQHEGTGIYGSKGRPIRPKKKPFLVFIPKGGTHVIRTKQVRGVRPDPFLVDALVQSVPWPIRRYHF